jgi:P pilus assembly chaperone PapD
MLISFLAALLCPVLLAAAFLPRPPRSVLLWLALVMPGAAGADLLVYPTRLVFEGNERAAQLDLHNNGKDTATYRISIVNRRMTETGSIVDAPQAGPGELFAEPMLRFSPRQVVLAPGATQTVRLSVRRPAGLADGEYRSHLHFEPVAETGGRQNLETLAKPGELGVQLQMLVGVSIPVIVRHGATSAKVTLSELALAKGTGERAPALAFVLHRTGNRSVHGDLGATFTPHGGSEQAVGKAAGVAVYTPNPLRRGRLELQVPAGLALARGTLRLTYRERPEAGGRLLAEAVLALP